MRCAGDHDEQGGGSSNFLAYAVIVASVLSAGMCLPATASGPQVNIGQVAQLAKQLKEVERIWKKTAGKDDKLSLNEVIALLKSPDLLAAVKMMAKGIEVALPSESKIKSLFKLADKDKSNTLCKVEFLGLFLGVFAEVIVANPLVLANVLVDFVDKDGDGKLQGREVKSLLAMVGIPPIALMLVPDEQAIDYKSVLSLVGPKC